MKQNKIILETDTETRLGEWLQFVWFLLFLCDCFTGFETPSDGVRGQNDLVGGVFN
jgi:hypothetical protein